MAATKRCIALLVPCACIVGWFFAESSIRSLGAATGGATSTGGSKASGGTTSAGGRTSTGGTRASGGTLGSGGFVPTGGTGCTIQCACICYNTSTGGTSSTGGTTSTVPACSPTNYVNWRCGGALGPAVPDLHFPSIPGGTPEDNTPAPQWTCMKIVVPLAPPNPAFGEHQFVCARYWTHVCFHC